VIALLPTANAVVAKVAIPPVIVPVPIVVPPLANVTVPVGAAPADVTVAVKVTDWPEVDGFTEEANAVVVTSPIP